MFKPKALFVSAISIGVPVIILNLIFWSLKLNDYIIFDYIEVLFFATLLLFVQKKYRDIFYKGYVNYGKLYGDTVLIMLIVFIIIYIYTFVFYKSIASENLDMMLKDVRLYLYENSFFSTRKKNEIYRFIKQYFYNPMFLSLTTSFIVFLEGLFFSIVTCYFIQKKKKLHI